MSDTLSGQPVSEDRAPPPAELDPVADVFIGVGDSAPTDDAPTIISKNQPQAAKPKSTASHKRTPDSVLGNSVRGRTLAHFELIEPIGVGGMAAVLRARDKQLDRCVALKILPPEMATDPENVARFHQEARAAAKLDHENIARVFFCGEDQRLHFIAFEFVEGNNLRTLLERRGRLPVPEAVHYMLQIATGLAHAASRGVVHRDIKPSNIIISPNGRAKLVDMGLARSLEKHADKDLTQSGVTLGTFDYISPEQALEPRDADVRSDIYSLGCTFYHMLTGQPPVPEGTAAKKLHHHQHVAPVDPRQLNPQIPDEVAAILVRMMAKDLKDRYQRAEHLVQHLIQVAQKLGAIPDMPDGVLFVDAPLPTPPRRRPLLTASLGALLLGLLLILRAVAVPQADPLTLPGNAFSHAQGKDPLDKSQGKQGEAPKEGPGERRDVFTARDLKEALTARELPTKIVLQNSIVLPPEGLIFRGGNRSVTIESKPGKPQTLSFTYLPTAEERKEFRAGLTVENGVLKFYNVRLEVILEEATLAAPKIPVAGVMVEKSASAYFMKCVFSQKTPRGPPITLLDLIPVASVAGWNPISPAKNDPPDLRFEECLFERGQAAVALTGTGSVNQIQCALGSHGTLFHLRGKNGPQETELTLGHISAHLVDGPAFRLDDGRTCKLRVAYSIFSRTESKGSDTQRDPPDLIRQTSTARLNFTYEGQRNGYYGLKGFWAGPGSSVPWEDFLKEIRKNGGRDDGSVRLKVRPWYQSDPIAFLPEPANPSADGDELKIARSAFQVKLDLPELRLESKSTRLLGVEQCVWGPTYDKVPLLEGTQPAEVATIHLKPNERLFDQNETRDIARVHRTLAGAIADARSGEVILIKHNGTLVLDSMTVQGTRDLTIKPYQDCKPILTLVGGGDAPSVSAVMYPALFEVLHGTLRFEQLAFHLKMPKGGYGPLTVVAITGNAACYFKQCQVTLETDAVQPPLSAVAIYDSRDLMKMGSQPIPRVMPVVRWQESLVRGQGDFLCVKASRPFELEANHCLVAVSGSLLHVHNNSVDVSENSPAARVKLTQVTALVLDSLLHVRAGKSGKAAVKTEVEANHNLFAGTGMRPVVVMYGIENDDHFRRLLSYTGDHNAYCGFDPLVEAQNAEIQPAVNYTLKAWRGFTGEEENNLRFGPVRFKVERFNTELTPLDKVTPGDFEIKADPKMDLQGYGVPLDLLRFGSGMEKSTPPSQPNDETQEAVDVGLRRERVAWQPCLRLAA